MKKAIIIFTTAIIVILMATLLFRNKLYNETFQPYNAQDIKYDGLSRGYYLNSNNNNIEVIYQKVPEKDYIIIYFHGNAGRLKNTINYLKENKHPFVSMAYPGYHGSSGKPSVKSINNSVALLMNFIKQNFSKNERIKIYIIGHSLGSQTALHFASLYSGEISKIFIVNGFASVKQVCEYKLQKYHMQNLCIIANGYFNGLSEVSNINLPPYYQFHLKNDNVIPYDAGFYLYNKVNAHIKHFTTIENGIHRDIPHDDVIMLL